MGMICPFELRFKIQDCKIKGYKNPCMLSCRDEPTRDKIHGMNLSRGIKSWDETF
jgi:hypothetical protein